MKIKQEFWELIKQNKKTIELRKVHGINNYLSDYLKRGRYEINLYSPCINNYHIVNPLQESCKIKHLGKIIINGYSIIKNPFKLKLLEKDSIDEFVIWTQDNLTKLQQKTNSKWLFDYWDWLVDYFKNEEEILILNIESWLELWMPNINDLKRIINIEIEEFYNE